LAKILKRAISFLHLKAQIHRFKRRKTAHALTALPSAADRIRLSREPGISDL